MTNESNTNIPTTPAEGNGAAAGPPPAPPGDDGGDLPEITSSFPVSVTQHGLRSPEATQNAPDCFATALVL